MKGDEARTFVVSAATTVPGLADPLHVAIRRHVTIKVADSFKGESEEAAVAEFRVAWRLLQRRLRDIDDGVAE